MAAHKTSSWVEFRRPFSLYVSNSPGTQKEIADHTFHNVSTGSLWLLAGYECICLRETSSYPLLPELASQWAERCKLQRTTTTKNFWRYFRSCGEGRSHPCGHNLASPNTEKHREKGGGGERGIAAGNIHLCAQRLHLYKKRVPNILSPEFCILLKQFFKMTLGGPGTVA